MGEAKKIGGGVGTKINVWGWLFAGTVGAYFTAGRVEDGMG